jgi:hypothetical protein
MKRDPHIPNQNSAANQPKERPRFTAEVLELSKDGFNVCWSEGDKELKEFTTRLIEPFKLDTNRGGQYDSLAAVRLIIDEFRNDLEDFSYRYGLIKALNCAMSVLTSVSDICESLSDELKELEAALVPIIRHERFLPATVLNERDEVDLQISRISISCFLLCREYNTDSALPLQATKEQLQAFVSDALKVAAAKVEEYYNADELSEISAGKLGLIRDWAMMAVCFPSKELSAPLITLARLSAQLAGEDHLFFPDVEPPEERYDLDDEFQQDYDFDEQDDREYSEDYLEDQEDPVEIDDVTVSKTGEESWRASMEIEDPSAEFETVSATCFSALAFCQDGTHIVPIWRHILDKTEPDDVEWATALVGLSIANAEGIQIYLNQLFDQITAAEPDEFVAGMMQEIATNAILELIKFPTNH